MFEEENRRMNTEEERIALEKTHVERDWAHLEVGLNDCTGIIFSSTSHGLPMCARPTCHGLNRTAECGIHHSFRSVSPVSRGAVLVNVCRMNLPEGLKTTPQIWRQLFLFLKIVVVSWCTE